jgi:hypothetical protein
MSGGGRLRVSVVRDFWRKLWNFLDFSKISLGPFCELFPPKKINENLDLTGQLSTGGQ